MSSKRSFWTESYSGDFTQKFAGNVQVSQHTITQGFLTDYMISLGHPYPPPRRLRGIDLGGNWSAVQYSFQPHFWYGTVKYSHGLFEYIYDGAIAPRAISSVAWPDPYSLSDNDLNSLGAAGFRNTIPTRPRSQVGQFVAELHDLPKVPLLRAFKKKALFFKHLARHAGEEYLNIEFGWAPFLSDIVKATKVTLHAKKLVHDFYYNSGKVVRRQTSKKTESSVVTSGTSVQGWPSQLANLNLQNPKYNYVDTLTKSTWFCAAYTYYIPKRGTDWISNIVAGKRIMDYLYGTRVDPELLWNLAPWSWMADYFGNVGDIIANANAFSQDNLVAKYAYVMCESTMTRQHTFTAISQDGKSIVSTMACSVTNKQRKAGYPYGFAVNPVLSTGQTAILGALGLSKFPRRT